MERSMGQQLKMVPFGDQQPFLLQLSADNPKTVVPDAILGENDEKQ